MSSTIVRGIVTASDCFSDNDRRIKILTEKGRIVEGKAYGARGSKSVMTAASQLFTYADFYLSERLIFYSVIDAVILQTFKDILYDFDRYTVGYAMLRAMNSVANKFEENEDLFLLLYHAISYAAFTDLNIQDLLTGYLVKLMHYSGDEPMITNCANCGELLTSHTELYFSNYSGGALCKECRKTVLDARRVEPLTLEIFRRINLLDIPEINKVVMPEHIRRETCAIMVRYAEERLDTKLFIKKKQ